MQCDPNEKGVKHTNIAEFNPDSCHNTLSFNSSSACPAAEFTSWYNNGYFNPTAVGAIWLCLGFFLIFFGHFYIKTTTAISLAFLTLISLNVILGQFFVISPFSNFLFNCSTVWYRFVRRDYHIIFS
jgi:hypothetical protein